MLDKKHGIAELPRHNKVTSAAHGVSNIIRQSQQASRYPMFLQGRFGFSCPFLLHTVEVNP
jgi:hypothetical protein